MTAGERIVLWWRDDDAGRHHPALDLLLASAREHAVPLGLAVVPAWLDRRSTDAVLASPGVDLLQHGWAHENHAPAGQKAIELGGSRATAACLDHLRRGRAVLEAAFGERSLPVLVPPWNRIDPAVTAGLPGLGFGGLSTFAEDRHGCCHGLLQVNTHLDVIDWRRDRRMKPLGVLQTELAALMARPAATVIGLLTHHLLMGAAEFDRLSVLLSQIEGDRRLAWSSPRMLFSPG